MLYQNIGIDVKRMGYDIKKMEEKTMCCTYSLNILFDYLQRGILILPRKSSLGSTCNDPQ